MGENILPKPLIDTLSFRAHVPKNVTLSRLKNAGLANAKRENAGWKSCRTRKSSATKFTLKLDFNKTQQ